MMLKQDQMEESGTHFPGTDQQEAMIRMLHPSHSKEGGSQTLCHDLIVAEWVALKFRSYCPLWNGAAWIRKHIFQKWMQRIDDETQLIPYQPSAREEWGSRIPEGFRHLWPPYFGYKVTSDADEKDWSRADLQRSSHQPINYQRNLQNEPEHKIRNLWTAT